MNNKIQNLEITKTMTQERSFASFQNVPYAVRAFSDNSITVQTPTGVYNTHADERTDLGGGIYATIALDSANSISSFEIETVDTATGNIRLKETYSADGTIKKTDYGSTGVTESLYTDSAMYHADRPMHQIVYDSNGTKTRELFNIYDPAGQVVIASDTYQYSNGVRVSRYYVEYKDDGTTKKSSIEETYDPSGTLAKTISKTYYDSGRLKVRTIDKYKNGKLKIRTIDKYNAKGERTYHKVIKYK